MIYQISECSFCGGDEWEEMETWTDEGEFFHYQCLACGAQSPFETDRENALKALRDGFIRNVYVVARDLAARK